MTAFPSGGNIARCLASWERLTSDPWILGIVKGFKLPFWTLPWQDREPRPFNLSEEQKIVFQEAVDDLLRKDVIEETRELGDQFISNIFVRPKPNGKVRLILDLTELNKFLILQHFKLENFNTALQMVDRDNFMSTIDLQDAYFSVKIHSEFRKYLRFRWDSKLFQFRAVPMGLACAPFIFTKILNPLFSQLRESGRTCFCYLDDVFMTDVSEEACKRTTVLVVERLRELGFKIHEEKSQFSPRKVVKFLGFMIDSREMIAYLPEDKIEKVTEACTELLQGEVATIQKVSSVVGLLNSYAKAVDYGDNHIKGLEIDKVRALQVSGGNFGGHMQVSKRGEQDLNWWVSNADKVVRRFGTRTVSSTLITDASDVGWGAVWKENTSQGKWLDKETHYHINEKELLAVLFGLKTLCIDSEGTTIRVLSDNATTVSYINRMGGVRSPRCNKIAHEIWKYCEGNNLWLTAAHIPGSQNCLADDLSRNFSNNVEWCLNDDIFDVICKRMGRPSVDLFATRLNSKLVKFCSWRPDPEAWRIDAFSFKWESEFFFVFPPFRLIGRVWRKIMDEEAHAILVVPRWPSQTWYPMVMNSARRVLWFKKRPGNLSNQLRQSITGSLTSIPMAACLY